MPDPLSSLLATKLHMPRPRPHLVVRPHLVEQLQQGMGRALTLVSAPAGFGKTTLLAQWLAESGTPAGWVSLGPEDNDPTSFLSYLIAALQTLDAQIGSTALALLRTPQPPSPETVLAVLTNNLAGREGDFTLVLDDYHVIADERIHRGMTFLLEHLPSQMHLILASRADPPLQLARLRAQVQLCEVRTADLRFGTAEANTFLRTVMGLDLEVAAIAILERRTEGWIAGLQLAALSLQGRADVSRFLAAFSGSHRYVLDYLSEEVLAHQPEPVQRFLLHTSILERLSGLLCDAVREQEGSQSMLEALEKANLFVVPLDDERRWYRYHHLFADVLRNHLQQAEPALIPILHRRASTWYEQHELTAEAVQHALAVPDVERAARLIETVAFSVIFQGQISTVLDWMAALPETLVRVRPLLSVQQASYLMFSNQLEAAEARLQEAERGIREQMPAAQVQLIQGYILTMRSGIANLSGETMQGVSLARQALELLPETEVIPRMGALVTAAHAYLVSGDVTPDSEREFAAADALIRSTGNLLAVERSRTLLGRLYVLQGRLRMAATAYEQVRQSLQGPEALQSSFGNLFYHFALGDLLRECNELEAAERNLLQGMALINELLTLEPFVAQLGYTALARLEQARGNSYAALATLDALANLVQQRRFASHLLTQGAAVRAQLELAQGDLAAAIRWADASGLSTEDENLSYPREGEYLALARVRITQGRDDPAGPLLSDALHLLERLQRSAEVKARMNNVLEIVVLRALALEAQGDRTAALSTLERALLLAAPEGYMRLFLDEGMPMLALLRLGQARGMVPAYVARLLAAFGEHTRAHPAYHTTRSSSLVEPFTEREREVLLLLLEGASNRGIARHLVISVNTVKKHVYNICGKLGVQSPSLARLGQHLTWISQTTWLGLRSLFRKRASAALTLLMLSVAGTSFLVVQTTASSVNETIGLTWSNIHADVEVYADESYRQARAQLGTLPNVGLMERFGIAGAQTPWGKLGLWGFEPQTQLYHYQLTSGRWLREGDTNVVLLSDAVARETGLHVGRRLAVTSLGGSRTLTWTVIGTLKESVDSLGQIGTAVVPVTTLYQFEGTPAATASDFANKLLIQARDRTPTGVSQLADQIDAIGTNLVLSGSVGRGAGLGPVFLVQDEALRHQREFYILYALLYAVALLTGAAGILGLASTLAASVVERQREIGLVRAMGASSWRVAQVFWVEGLALGSIAWCLGALLGVPLAYAFLQFFSRLVIPVDVVVDPLAFLVMLAALLLIVTLASIVPARRASHLRIADLLRYE